MSNASKGNYEPSVIPTAFLSHEDYTLIWRLLKRGDVRLQLAITNTFSTAPVETSNTVAELRGAEKPDEVVILGAHVDSWDLASGSTDNGTGVVLDPGSCESSAEAQTDAEKDDPVCVVFR